MTFLKEIGIYVEDVQFRKKREVDSKSVESFRRGFWMGLSIHILVDPSVSRFQ